MPGQAAVQNSASDRVGGLAMTLSPDITRWLRLSAEWSTYPLTVTVRVPPESM
jgi:hypothetical protein